MGKLKRQRQNYHEVSNKSSDNNQTLNTSSTSDTLQLLPTSDNPFAGIDISFDSLKKNLSDDVRSVRSFKSTKSELDKKIPKKDKIKLRREILLQKIDSVNQLKKKYKERTKRKKNVIIGDTNALHDALPSLESLCKSTEDVKAKTKVSTKKKAIAKASKRKKNMLEGVQIFKKLLTDKNLKSDRIKLIKEHVKQRVQSGNL